MNCRTLAFSEGSRYFKYKKIVYQALSSRSIHNKWSKSFHAFLIGLIILNVLAVMLETVKEIDLGYSSLLDLFETISVAIFSIEYILRVWCCNIDPKYMGAVRGRIKYVLTPMAIIDLVSILPFYIPFFIVFIASTAA